MESSDPKKRKKVVAYLHPALYPQDNLTQQTIDSLPVQMREISTDNPLFAEQLFILLTPDC